MTLSDNTYRKAKVDSFMQGVNFAKENLDKPGFQEKLKSTINKIILF